VLSSKPKAAVAAGGQWNKQMYGRTPDPASPAIWQRK